MKIIIRQAIRLLFITTVLMFGNILPSFSADLQMFTNARLINDPANDGDSFLVEANGKSFRIRLYLVDCPETSASFRSGAERVREQTRYFGLSDAARAIHFGNKAKAFTEHALLKPFIVHTAFASALGSSPNGRVYAFITTADGKDLAR
jgi:competence protein ComEA